MTTTFYKNGKIVCEYEQPYYVTHEQDWKGTIL